MDVIKKTIITSLLAIVFISGGGTIKAYTPTESNKTLVYQPEINITVALEKY